MRKIVLDKTETISANTALVKCNFLIDAFSILKDELVKLDNVEYVDIITIESDSSNEKRKMLFDIGYNNIYLFIGLNAGNYNNLNVGLCKKDDYSEVVSYSISNGYTFQCGSATGGYKCVFVASAFMVVNNNKLSAFFISFPTDNLGSSSFLLLDSDNYGNNFVFIGGASGGTNELYYDNDDTYTKHTVDATHITNGIEGKVWLSNTIIYLNNSLKALTTGLLKICNSTLATNTGLSGTLIDVEGTRYRKLNYCWWVEDNE